MKLLHLKYPEQQEANNETLLQGPMKQVYNIVSNDIDEASVMKAAKKTKCGCGPSGFDADN